MGDPFNGGPAYPVNELDQVTGQICAQHMGLTVRDHFAGLAMQAAATDPTGADGFTFAQRASWAYQQADAMLKARQSNG